MRYRIRLAAAIVVPFAGPLAGTARAAYPTRPVTIMIPAAAGGPSDSIARIIAESLGRYLGERVIILNNGAAGGTVGTNRVVTATPDGYMLLMHHVGLATAPALYKSLSYDPVKDLAPIGRVAEAPMSIVTRKGFPADTLTDLIAYLRAKQDKITYASAGIGSASFLCGLLFEQRIGVKLSQIPYTGTGPAYTDLLAGRVDTMCDLTTGTASYIQTGALKAYALTAETRMAILPDLPTTTEAGLPHFDVSVWYGLYAPAKTPDAIIQRLSKALQATVQEKAVADRLAPTGTNLVTPAQATPAALREQLQSQIDLWRPIIEKSGVSVQ